MGVVAAGVVVGGFGDVTVVEFAGMVAGVAAAVVGVFGSASRLNSPAQAGVFLILHRS